MNDLPPGWEWTTLEELASPEPRAMTDGPFGSNLKSSHYVDAGPRVIRLQNIGFGTFIDEQAHISRQHFESLRAHEVSAGDLVIASLGERLPRSCILPESVGLAIVKADCIRVRLHPEIDRQYVNYALQRPALRRSLSGQIHGVGRPRLGMAGIKALAVPICATREQTRIVLEIESYFSRLDAAEASLRSAQRRCGLLLKRIIDSASEGEPVRLGALLRDPLRNGLSARRAVNGSVRVVTLTAVTRSEFTEDNTKLIEPDNRSVDDLWMSPGDIFVQRSNTPDLVGTASMYRGDPRWAIFPDLLIRVRPNDRVDPEYLELVLRSETLRRYFRRSAKGIAGSMPKISQPILEAAEIPLPDRARQRDIVVAVAARVDGARQLETQVTKALFCLHGLRCSILAAAFSGELVPQDPADEPASVLMARIRAERATLPKARRPRKVST